MHQVYVNATSYFELSEQALIEMDQFVIELAQFCHGESNASASAICYLEQSEDESSTVGWFQAIGEDAELLSTFGHAGVWNAEIINAIQTGVETRLLFCRETGTFTNQDNDEDEKAESNGVPEYVELGPLEYTPVADSSPGNLPHENGASSNGRHLAKAWWTTDFSVASSLYENEVSQERLADQPHPHEEPFLPSPIAALWIRPLSAINAVVSICQIDQENKTEFIHVVHNAHTLREIHGVLGQARAENESTRKILRLATGLSGSLPLPEQAYHQANEIRQYLDCDRVAIFDINRHCATALAVSGQPKFNRRSNSIRASQDLVGSIAQTGEAFWFNGDFEELSDSLKKKTKRYMDETLVNSFAIFPLIQQEKPTYPSEEETMQEAISPGSASKQKTIGAVLVEQTEDFIDREPVQEEWNLVKPLVTNQYAKSRQYDSIFLIRLWTLLGRFAAFYRGQTKRKAWIITSLIVVFIFGSLLVQSDFKVRCEGYLIVEGTKDLYSQGDGLVSELNVHDGKQVQAGEVLIVQENLELENERLKLIGQISQLRAEIDEFNDKRVSAMLFPESDKDRDSPKSSQEVRKREVELNELLRQKKIVEQEIAHLTIRAPFAGTIAGWKAERRLLDRPLEKGTHLFSVIPLDAECKLELRVPDQRAGYVQTAWQQAQTTQTSLEIVFRLASAPGVDRYGHVTFVSPGLEKDEDIGYALPVYARSQTEIPTTQLRSRTAVMGKVVCGRGSLAYCKSYEALDWLKSKFFEFVY